MKSSFGEHKFYMVVVLMLCVFWSSVGWSCSFKRGLHHVAWPKPNSVDVPIDSHVVFSFFSVSEQLDVHPKVGLGLS